jgi:hypothetical protein
MNHEHPNVCDIGQGKARYRKNKRLKLGDRLVYERSAD